MEKKDRIADEVRRLREEGVPAAEVAEMFGVSRARIYQIFPGKKGKGFTPIKPDQNIYPMWRNWMNENSVSVRMFIRLMGLDLSSTTYNNVYGWMRGRCYPSKKNIDRILETTGLTYEQLFYQEEAV
jgi:transcriptional regulator with XRE-family HTH domain